MTIKQPPQKLEIRASLSTGNNASASNCCADKQSISRRIQRPSSIYSVEIELIREDQIIPLTTFF
jgi:hypothetical protein